MDVVFSEVGRDAPSERPEKYVIVRVVAKRPQ